MKKLLINFFTLFCSIIFFSCATTVKVSIERPAELDLNGAEELSIIPFQSNAGNVERGIDATVSVIDLFASIATGHNITHGKLTDQIKVADYLTNQITNNFYQSNYMKLVQSSAVEAALKSGSKIPCDVYLTGNISNFENDINRIVDYEYENIKVEENGETVTKKIKRKVIKYKREVSFDVYYKIIDAETNRITAMKSYHVHETSSSAKKSYDVPSTVDCVSYELRSIASTIMRQIQPYYVTKTYQLLKDKTKNEQMKTANKLAKDGLLNESQQLFESLYKEFHYPEALYNSAVLLASLQKYELAEKQLNELITIMPSTDAYNALNDVKKEIQQKQRLLHQKELKGTRKNSGTKKAQTKVQPAQKTQSVKQSEPENIPEPKSSGIFTSDNYDDIEDL